MEIIGRGANGFVYRKGNLIYKKTADKSGLPYFKDLKKMFDIINKSYSIPSIKEIIESEQGLTIVKDYVPGTPLHNLLNENEGVHYLFDMVDLQININKVKVSLPKKFSDEIKASLNKVEIEHKEELLKELDQIKEECLCHGDFHPLNVIVEKEKLVAIDWDNACMGNPLMDAARTYLLFEAKRRGIGEIYLADYCKKTGNELQEAKKYIKFIAIEFLTEPANNQDKDFLYEFIR